MLYKKEKKWGSQGHVKNEISVVCAGDGDIPKFSITRTAKEKPWKRNLQTSTEKTDILFTKVCCKNPLQNFGGTIMGKILAGESREDAAGRRRCGI